MPNNRALGSLDCSGFKVALRYSLNVMGQEPILGTADRFKLQKQSCGNSNLSYYC